ncbi:2'-5' RNA ligase family protein [Deinococcus altitudinis]|uniref:2'-5' RNA ligase family protein n=1 Tax=Deinococcus altitudinis TaxID=468914 RepID=UPI0038919504
MPPAPLSARIVGWQQALAHAITAPHVTLKAPGHLSAAQLDACAEACRTAPAFEVGLGSVQTFGERVVFLEAVGAGLHALHARLVAAVGESATPFELTGYHPHLTLALGWRPFRLGGPQEGEHGKGSPEAWNEVLEHARASFADLQATPLSFAVTEAALFRKDPPGQPYHEVTRWNLEG